MYDVYVEGVIQETVAILLPVLSAGGSGAARGAVERSGSQLFDAAVRIAGRIRHRWPSGDALPTPDELGCALREGLASGELQASDLREILSLWKSEGATYQGGINVSGDMTARTVFSNSPVTITGDGHF